jgi:hypothetical protein
MACCAFIAFLVSQVYLLVSTGVRRLLPTARVASVPATAWRLDSVAPAGPRQSGATAVASRTFGVPRRMRPWFPLIAAGAIELAVLAGGVQWFVVGDGRQALADEIQWLAGIDSLAELKDLCSFRRSSAKDPS